MSCLKKNGCWLYEVLLLLSLTCLFFVRVNFFSETSRGERLGHRWKGNARFQGGNGFKKPEFLAPPPRKLKMEPKKWWAFASFFGHRFVLKEKWSEPTKFSSCQMVWQVRPATKEDLNVKLAYSAVPLLHRIPGKTWGTPPWTGKENVPRSLFFFCLKH